MDLCKLSLEFAFEEAQGASSLRSPWRSPSRRSPRRRVGDQKAQRGDRGRGRVDPKTRGAGPIAEAPDGNGEGTHHIEPRDQRLPRPPQGRGWRADAAAARARARGPRRSILSAPAGAAPASSLGRRRRSSKRLRPSRANQSRPWPLPRLVGDDAAGAGGRRPLQSSGQLRFALHPTRARPPPRPPQGDRRRGGRVVAQPEVAENEPPTAAGESGEVPRAFRPSATSGSRT